jgi:predicted adenine nucleotide alpha hydrolase (AANH) superfamily ATPase
MANSGIDLTIFFYNPNIHPKKEYEIRKNEKEVIIAASGTSCRHQIFDGTNRSAVHPAEILYDALR